MRPFRFLTHLILLFTIPLATCIPQEGLSLISIEEELHPFEVVYDSIAHLIDELISGELKKKSSEKDLEKLIPFLILLAREGILPGETEKAIALERDIEELLGGEYSLYQ